MHLHQVPPPLPVPLLLLVITTGARFPHMEVPPLPDGVVLVRPLVQATELRVLDTVMHNQGTGFLSSQDTDLHSSGARPLSSMADHTHPSSMVHQHSNMWHPHHNLKAQAAVRHRISLEWAQHCLLVAEDWWEVRNITHPWIKLFYNLFRCTLGRCIL